MKFTKFLLIFVLFFGIKSFAVTTYDDEDNLYLVRNIEVYSKSDNATNAKQTAIKEAQRKALTTIFERATIDTQYTKYVSDQILSDMIESIRIKDEIITKNSYSSKVNILFNKKFLNFHLKKLNIGVGKTTDDVVLYIPIFDDDSVEKIDIAGQKDMVWYKSAYKTFFDKKYENIYLIDNYSSTNTVLLDEKKLKDPKYDDYFTLLKKYASNVIIIGTAEYDKHDDVVTVYLKEIDANNITEKRLTFFNKESIEHNDFLAEASQKVMEYINNMLTQRRLAKNGDEKNLAKYLVDKSLDLIIIIPNLKEYVYLKNLLTNLPFIKKYETIEMTTKMAKVKVYYRGDENEIISMFSNKGFNLIDKNGQYFINYKGF